MQNVKGLGSEWYRKEAERFRQMGSRASEDPELRDRYLALAREYDAPAEILEKQRPS